MAEQLRYEIVIDDKGTATIKKVEKGLKDIGKTGEETANKITKSHKDSVAGVDQLEKAIQRLNRTAIAFIGMWALTKVLRLPGELLSQGIKFNSVIEDSRLGIASLLVASGEFRDSIGRNAQGWEKMNAAMELSSELIEEIKVKNLETYATMEQIVKAYQSGLSFGLQRGADPRQMLDYTVAMVQAAGALRMNLDMMAEELRSLMTGAISPRTSFIATALKITPEDIRRYQGDINALMKFIMERLDAFKYAGIMAMNTWTGLISNVKDAIANALGEGLKPLFEYFKEQLVGIQGYIIQVDEKTKKIKVNPELIESIKEVGKVIMALIEAFKLLHEWILGPMWSAIKFVFGGLAGMVEKTIETINKVREIEVKFGKEAKGPEKLSPPLQALAEMLGKGGAYLPDIGLVRSGAGIDKSLDATDKLLGITTNLVGKTEELVGKHAKIYNYKANERTLTKDEVDYLIRMSAELGVIDQFLAKQITQYGGLKTIFKDFGLDISDTSNLTRGQVEAIAKSVEEYRRLNETGKEVNAMFERILKARLRAAEIDELTPVLQIQLATAKQLGLTDEEVRLTKRLNELSSERLGLFNKITPALKGVKDFEVDLITMEMTRQKTAASLGIQKDIEGQVQKYNELRQNYDAVIDSMKRQEDIEIRLIELEKEKTAEYDDWIQLVLKQQAIRRAGGEERRIAAVTLPAEKQKEILDLQMRSLELVGDYYGVKSKEIDILNVEQKKLLAINEANSEAVKAINEYYEKMKDIAKARRDMDIGKLAKFGIDKAAIDYQTQLADFYEKIFPSAIEISANAVDSFFHNWIEGSMSAGEAWKNFVKDIGKGVAKMLSDLAILYMKMALITALGGKTGGGEINWVGTILGGIFKGLFGGGGGGGGGNVPSYWPGFEEEGSGIGWNYNAKGYQHGTDYVPQTGLALLHKGEKVIPAGENAGSGGVGVTYIVIQANDAKSFDDMVRRNPESILGVSQRSSRTGGSFRRTLRGA